jgi:hypothetical protein
MRIAFQCKTLGGEAADAEVAFRARQEADDAHIETLAAVFVTRLRHYSSVVATETIYC